MIPTLLAQAASQAQIGMSIWIPVISALVASALTGIISYFQASQRLSHEERIEKWRFVIAKLEEAHQVTRSLRRFFAATYVQLSTSTQSISSVMNPAPKSATRRVFRSLLS